MPTSKIKTRVLIISDTHGSPLKPQLDGSSTTNDDELGTFDGISTFTGFREPLPEADVAIHCGDLTKRSTVKEYENTFAVMRGIRAPLKLVIAGNHDVALDEEFWVNNSENNLDVPNKVKAIIRGAEADGVRYLTEGSYDFDLDNGARLKVYASQYTPDFGGWAFQYTSGHDFDISSDADIAITHGPPLGILDMAQMTKSNAGCPFLLEAIRKAKPKIHCFGHIHEAWGSALAQWNVPADVSTSVAERTPSSVVARTHERGLSWLWPRPGSSDAAGKRARLKEVARQRGVHLDLTQGEHKLSEDEQTLFVNAAIMDIRYRPVQMPWIIDVDLDRASQAADPAASAP